jgi:hypothetical protein
MTNLSSFARLDSRGRLSPHCFLPYFLAVLHLSSGLAAC